MTIEELETQLRALKKARASGVLIVRHGDTQVTYRSTDDLQNAINEVVKELNALRGNKRRPRYGRQNRKAL